MLSADPSAPSLTCCLLKPWMEWTNRRGHSRIANYIKYLYLGDIALNSDDEIAAEPLLAQAVQLQSELRLAHFDLGIIFAKQNKNPQALEEFERAVQLDPTQPDAHYRLARLYLVLGAKQKAQLEFIKTRALHARSEDALIQKVSGEVPRVAKRSASGTP